MTAKFESFNWLRAVSDDTRITIIHRLVPMRLCLHRRNDTGKCDPGYSIVADELGVHRATVFRAIDVGVRLGYLAQPTRRGPAKANLTLTFPNEVALELPLEVAAERPQSANEVAPVHKRGRTAAQKRSQRQRGSPAESDASARNGRSNGRKRTGESKSLARCARATHEAPDFNSADSKKEAAAKRKTSANSTSSAGGQKKNKGRDARAADEVEADFAHFLAVYPPHVAHVAEEPARRAFAKAIRDGTDPEVIIEQAKRYAVKERARIAREGRPECTKYPGNWLRDRRWTDRTDGGTVLDQDGNLVGYEYERPPPRDSRGYKTNLELVPELLAKLERDAEEWEVVND
jgi:hypothetical protein